MDGGDNIQKTVNRIAVLYYIRKAGVLEGQYRLIPHFRISVGIKRRIYQFKYIVMGTGKVEIKGVLIIKYII